MSTYTLWEAPTQIAKMPAERQQLPRLVNELFGTFIEGCGYKGYYTQPRRAGHQYFEFYGNTKGNKGYKVEIVIYYDELNITISRPIDNWHKALRFMAYTLLGVAGVLVLLLLIIGGEGGSFDLPGRKGKSDKRKPKKASWNANSFVVHKVVALLQPDAILEYRYNDSTATEVVSEYFEFFKTHLEDVLQGKRWGKGLENVDIFGD